MFLEADIAEVEDPANRFALLGISLQRDCQAIAPVILKEKVRHPQLIHVKHLGFRQRRFLNVLFQLQGCCLLVTEHIILRGHK